MAWIHLRHSIDTEEQEHSSRSPSARNAEEDEKLELAHLNSVIKAFANYESFVFEWIARQEAQFRSLSENHRALIPLWKVT
jgi:exonuclease V gamma subunit